MISIGIDNGISGAVVAIRVRNILLREVMPVQRYRKGNEIDVVALKCLIDGVIFRAGSEPVIVTIEEPGGSQNASAAVSMAASFAAIRTVCALMLVRHYRITPFAWQKVMMPGCSKGDTKPRALEVAKRIFPQANLLATDRCRVPHDGIVDALLIAEYGRLTFAD